MFQLGLLLGLGLELGSLLRCYSRRCKSVVCDSTTPVRRRLIVDITFDLPF